MTIATDALTAAVAQHHRAAHDRLDVMLYAKAALFAGMRAGRP